MFRYYKLNSIYIECDLERGIFRHWNPKTLIGKDDNISKYVMFKVIQKSKSITEDEFRTMFDRIGYFNWIKHPKIVDIYLDISVRR